MKYLCVFNDPTKIKFLILYTLKTAKKPLTNPQLTYLIIDNTETNHFDLFQALDYLIKIGYVHKFEGLDKKTLYMLTKEGSLAATNFERRVPLIVREYIANGIKPMFKNEKAKRQISTKVVAVSFDEFSVECKVCDDDMPLLTLSLYTGSKESAMAVQRRFKENTQEIYQRIVELLMPNNLNEGGENA